MHEKCCFPKSYRFSGFWRNHCCLPEFLLSFYRLHLSFVPTHNSFILLFNICDHGFLKQGEGGGVCARRKVLQRMEWALTLRPMDKWDPHRTPSKKRDTLKNRHSIKETLKRAPLKTDPLKKSSLLERYRVSQNIPFRNFLKTNLFEILH